MLWSAVDSVMLYLGGECLQMVGYSGECDLQEFELLLEGDVAVCLDHRHL